ncbi:MAG: cation:proton antiporter [Acidobacteriota bacterium]|jgi:NhaP-type Na+/H+ or K+/H+ antiporter
MYANLAVLSVFVLVYSLIAGRIDRMPLSGPIIFTGFGFLVGFHGLGILDLQVTGEGLRSLAELSLAVVLFTDAAGTDLGVLRRSEQIPIRLLLVGLPLTILAGFGAGIVLFPGLPMIQVALLATMLAPTDAALGSAVVTNPKVPASIREGLNVESGLNDGICVPVLFLFLAFATGATGGGARLGVRLVAEQIGIGLAVGLLLAAAGSWAVGRSAEAGWFTDPWERMAVVALAFSCFAISQILGGSGFIASFSGGLLFGALARERKERLLRPAEGIGDTLALITWVLFGSAMVGRLAGSLSWPIVVYAALSLTVVRMLPVFLVLSGSGLRTGDKLFAGWFGPRGLASIVFIVIVLNKLPGTERLSITVFLTVLLSILAHGFSANPLVALLGRRSGLEAAGARG